MDISQLHRNVLTEIVRNIIWRGCLLGLLGEFIYGMKFIARIHVFV